MRTVWGDITTLSLLIRRVLICIRWRKTQMTFATYASLRTLGVPRLCCCSVGTRSITRVSLRSWRASKRETDNNIWIFFFYKIFCCPDGPVPPSLLLSRNVLSAPSQCHTLSSTPSRDRSHSWNSYDLFVIFVLFFFSRSLFVAVCVGFLKMRPRGS